jgi:hypothetical protein
MRLPNYRIFFITLLATAIFIALKYELHQLDLELLTLGALHSAAISGVIFVIGFLLSATIADYKEAERIPAEVAAAIENMSADVHSIHDMYPKFNLKKYHKQLIAVAETFEADVRSNKSRAARAELYKLSRLSADLEKAGVPANFIVKLKQQQALLVRHLFRVSYIQRITFIPSATVLAWSIVTLAIAILLFTEVEPFIGGMMLAGAITFILVYVLQLIQVIKRPFHSEGRTQDDVSLFLFDTAIEQLRKQ